MSENRAELKKRGTIRERERERERVRGEWGGGGGGGGGGNSTNDQTHRIFWGEREKTKKTFK